MYAAVVTAHRMHISQKTRAALAAKKEAGIRLGRPSQIDRTVLERIIEERLCGCTLQAIADGLNDDAVPTTRGGSRWWVSTVRAALATAQLDSETR